MTEKAKEHIQPYVRSLLTCVAHVENGDDKFSHLENFVLSNIWSDKFIAVDRYAIRKSVDGVIKKFFIHGHSVEAEKLQSLLDKYLSSKDWDNDKQHDIQWSVLSLLLHLSYNPTGSISTDPQVIQPVPIEKKDDFDWPAYLLENQPDFISLGSGGSETEDECLSIDDELQGEILSLNEDITESVNEPKGVGGGETAAEATRSEACKEQIWAYIEDTTASACSWLEGNVQLPRTQGCRVPSKFASANLVDFCDMGKNEQPSVVRSEYRVLREALCALHVPPDPKLSSEHSKGLFFADQRCIYHAHGEITIPSLTKGSLHSHLSWIGSYVSMVRVIEGFVAEMSDVIRGNEDSRDSTLQAPQGGEGKDCHLPPLTFEAYASALKEFLSSFKEKVLVIEDKVKCQDGVCTLLSVAQELRPAFKELALVHRVHLDAISCWREGRNWLCSCRLLTVLYSALLSSFSDMGASICLHLFMKAFQPYLEIIHVWLTEGRLEDWREEFIISKNALMCGDTENFWKEGFILRPYEDELLKTPGNGLAPSSQPLGLLHLIRDKVLPLGKNMELLQRLDRLSEVQRSLPSFERSLYLELSSVLNAEMRDGTSDGDAVTDEAVMSPSLTLTVDCDPSSLLDSLVHGIQGSKDYYLRMAFGDVSCLDGKDPILPSGGRCEVPLGAQGPEEDSTGVVLPLKVERWLGRLLDARHGMSSLIVRTILLGEFSLTSHILVVRKVFLMEEGDCMQRFCTHLFQQVERGEKWVDTLSLTNHLHECMSHRFPDVVSNFSVLTSLDATSQDVPCSSHSLLDQVDHIHINYAIQWPVNIVLNAASMESYNTVFQFLLKVKWALWSLQQLRFCDLCPSREYSKVGEEEGEGGAVADDDDSMPMCAKAHRLQLLRAWLLHFVGSVHAYLMGQVLHILGVRMDRKLEAANDLDSIIHEHENYLELIYQQCLQTKNSEIIKMAITRVLDISMALCQLWKQPAIITPRKLYDMESQYIRHHVFLARVLENALSRGFVDHLKTLVSALVHSFPSH